LESVENRAELPEAAGLKRPARILTWVSNKRPLILLLAVLAAAAALRAYLLPFPASCASAGCETDLELLRQFSVRLADVGPHDYYLARYDHYLPGYLYVLWGIGALHEAFFADISTSTYFIILKLPANFFDFATAFLIYKTLSKRMSVYAAIAGCAFYLFNPAIFYNSAVWGQFEAAQTFFMFAAIYLLLARKPELAAISMAVAVLVKAQAVGLVPVFALALLMRTPPRRILSSAAVGLAVLFFIQLPFFPRDPFFGGMVSLARQTMNNYPFTSLNAWNLWEIVGGVPKGDATTWLGITYQTWGIILWLAAQGAAAFWLFRRPRDDWSTYWAASLALFAFFILPTRIHERYLFPFFAFFLVAAMLSRYRIPLLVLYAFVSVLHFLNLYFVQQPKPYPIFDSFFSYTLSHDVAISALLTASFVFLLVAPAITRALRLGVPQEEAHAG
jgi:dolichyl-phosphate-mannose-protein mannosyltransferase